MENMYNNGKYIENNPNWHQEDSAFKADHIKQIIQKNNISFQTVAEIGCGMGGIITKLAEYFPEANFSGYDISEDVFKLLPTNQMKNVHFYNEDLIVKDVQFDILIMADVFEHVPDYLGFIKNASKKSKYVIFHIPLDMSVQKLLRPKSILDNRYNVGHLHYFCKETALATLEDSDLEILDFTFTKWGLETKQKSILKKIGKIPLFILDKISTDLAARIMGGNSLLVLTKTR